MKFCQPHWLKLQAAVKENRMWHLVSSSQKEAKARIERQSRNVARPNDFDPLLSAHNAILSNALLCGGQYLLEKEYCPLCELDKNTDTMKVGSKDWIKNAVEGAKKFCMENDLMEKK